MQQLEYLVALSRERHFGRAAASCHVSQPALSAGLQRLERELGVTIVQRSRRFEGFTPEGARVVTWAHRILAERTEMVADLDRFRGQLTATARLGVIPTAVGAVPLITEAFRATHPMATLRVLTLPSREISRLLTDFEVDAGLTYLNDETPPGTRHLPLYGERYFLLTPSTGTTGTGLVDAQTGEVRWRGAATLPLCALTTDMRHRRIIEANASAAGATLRPVVEANTVGALYVHLTDTTAKLSAIVPHPWLKAFGIPPGLSALPMATSGVGPPVGLITPDRGHASVLADALWDAALQADVRGALDTWLRAHLETVLPWHA